MNTSFVVIWLISVVVCFSVVGVVEGADPCNAYTICTTCTNTGGVNCGWCTTTRKCVTGTATGMFLSKISHQISTFLYLILLYFSLSILFNISRNFVFVFFVNFFLIFRSRLHVMFFLILNSRPLCWDMQRHLAQCSQSNCVDHCRLYY